MNIFYAAVSIVFVTACASAPEVTSDNTVAKQLLGKSRAELLQCAGTPVKEVVHGDGVIFRYYKEAPMLDEARPFLKGSIAQSHHGCWARLLLEKDEVTGVEFRPVPKGTEYEHCEEIFVNCRQ
jgi:hypothetical protein